MILMNSVASICTDTFLGGLAGALTGQSVENVAGAILADRVSGAVIRDIGSYQLCNNTASFRDLESAADCIALNNLNGEYALVKTFEAVGGATVGYGFSKKIIPNILELAFGAGPLVTRTRTLGGQKVPCKAIQSRPSLNGAVFVVISLAVRMGPFLGAEAYRRMV